MEEEHKEILQSAWEEIEALKTNMAKEHEENLLRKCEEFEALECVSRRRRPWLQSRPLQKQYIPSTVPLRRWMNGKTTSVQKKVRSVGNVLILSAMLSLHYRQKQLGVVILMLRASI
mmetsp:Transcript_47740/g.65019  ORF Transcript_47740/g.65019 Transcript_47740/m.65019 type:complete len:117 (+) Transcript_47740:105-455(+)